MQEAEQQEAIDTKSKGTPPGWKPASQLPRLKAPHGWTAKWSNPAKLTERLSEGWKVMKPDDNRGEEILNIDVNDVGSLTGALRYRARCTSWLRMDGTPFTRSCLLFHSGTSLEARLPRPDLLVS